MDIPEKAQELLDMIQNYGDLQASNQVLISFTNLSEKFTTGELELAENFLLKNKILAGAKTREMPTGDLSGCLKRLEEIIDQPTYEEAVIDFHVHSSWKHDGIKVYELGNIQRIKFSEEKAILKIGDKEIELTPSKNEFELCRAMFRHEANEWVDWSEVYAEMNGKDVSDVAKEKKAIRDTYARLNERIKKEVSIKDLFIWRGNSIKRRL